MVQKLVRSVRYYRDFFQFRRMLASSGRTELARWEDRYPCLHNATGVTHFDRHYVFHPAWAARIVVQTHPSVHTDISSTLHFCSLVSAFVPVHFYDYRPAELNLSNLTSGRADLLALPFDDRSMTSLSCMQVVEHIGLGRYGDPLDPNGDIKAMRELQRVLAVGGNLLFVVPVGRPRILFNAHRIYASRQIMEQFSDLVLEQFALVPDREEDGGLIVGASPAFADQQEYGCGCFWFRRI